MGTFEGHALAGSFYFLWSLWLIVNTFSRYYKHLKGNTTYKTTLTYNCCTNRLKHVPGEAILKVFCPVVGITGEMIFGFGDRGWFTTIVNGQHSTMYFFFALSGATDILLHYGAPVPKGIDYSLMLLALGVEALLFKMHLFGRSDLDTLVHMLIVYVSILCILTLALEMKYHKNVMCALSRDYFFLLQGTWFIQVGFILYNPDPNAERWKDDDHKQIMIVTMMFAWHCAGDSLLMLLIGGVVAFYHVGFRIRNCGVKMTAKHNCEELILVTTHPEDSDSEV